MREELQEAEGRKELLAHINYRVDGGDIYGFQSVRDRKSTRATKIGYMIAWLVAGGEWNMMASRRNK